MGLHEFASSSTADILKARCFLMLAALLYGTSFPLIKILDDNMPVGISLALRFGLASLVTLPWLLERPPFDWNSSFEAAWEWSRPRRARYFTYEMWLLVCGIVLIGMISRLSILVQAAFFCSLSVIVVPFLNRLVGRELDRIQLFSGLKCVAIYPKCGTTWMQHLVHFIRNLFGSPRPSNCLANQGGLVCADRLSHKKTRNFFIGLQCFRITCCSYEQFATWRLLIARDTKAKPLNVLRVTPALKNDQELLVSQVQVN